MDFQNLAVVTATKIRQQHPLLIGTDMLHSQGRSVLKRPWLYMSEPIGLTIRYGRIMRGMNN